VTILAPQSSVLLVDTEISMTAQRTTMKVGKRKVGLYKYEIDISVIGIGDFGQQNPDFWYTLHMNIPGVQY
jgi:hypothetical protein